VCNVINDTAYVFNFDTAFPHLILILHMCLILILHMCFDTDTAYDFDTDTAF
jgi:hypothetical protein